MDKHITIVLTNKCNLKCKHCFAIRNTTSMSMDILEKTITYLINEANNNPSNRYLIEFFGGEIGLYDPNILSIMIDYMRDNVINNNVEIYAQSNLVYNLTDEWLNLFKKMDYLDTSYDYSIRFSNEQQRELWFNNVRKITSNGIELSCVITITKDVVENLTPRALFDIMLGLGIKKIELERLFPPLKPMVEYDNGNIVATNRDVDKWMFDAYLLYEKLKDVGVYVETFNCMEESICGNNYYEHSRCCQENNLTFLPNGDVSQCFVTSVKPFFNILNPNNKNMDIYNENVLFEKKLNDGCRDCPYLKYCRGDCCMMKWDSTGCPTPKLIYEYLLTKGE